MSDMIRKKKPIYKRVWFWAIIVVLVIFFVLPSSDSKKEINSTETNENGSTAATETTIEEQVLFDHDGVKITAKEYVTDSIWGEGIKLLIENDGEKTVGVSCDDLIVNDYMMSNMFSASVAPGKKVNETLDLFSTELEAAGITNVGQVEIQFHLYDEETFETTYTAELVTIKTSNYENMDTTPDDAGQELYNEDGIRIVGKYVDEDSFWGSAVLLYMENNSGRDVIISSEDLSVNGYMITSLLSSHVNDGKKCIDEITLFSESLEENNIESIDEIELRFEILDPDTYETITSTEMITFKTIENE